ncbi:hypothetical protein WL57_32590 [Burkholderia cepacia]|uniref:hypothetical protein n=1 Tax=Burkholderia cepacia TaxID=292 RepID=UPI00075E01DB|nr:hypothetical protein [Burkholderia cepacia]KWC78450.1 hypothetical protein WL57_32590 [Burkholderia cepacia]
MTGYQKRNGVPQDDAHGLRLERQAERVRATVQPGDQHRDANWAWARSGAGYDWMDHAPLFEHSD